PAQGPGRAARRHARAQPTLPQTRRITATLAGLIWAPEAQLVCLDGHAPLRMDPTDLRGVLAMAGDHTHALVELVPNVVRVGALEERDLVAAAGREDLLARLLHLGWVGKARHVRVAERQAQVARAELGEAESRHRQDLVGIGNPLRTLQLDPEQQ